MWQLRHGGFPVVGSDAVDAGEAVHAVVRSRLQLVPVVHAVIALELGVVRQRDGRSPPCVVVHIQLRRLFCRP